MPDDPQTAEPSPASLWTLSSALSEIERLRAAMQNVADETDAILRGRHSGWDQALSKLRTAAREALRK